MQKQSAKIMVSSFVPPSAEAPSLTAICRQEFGIQTNRFSAKPDCVIEKPVLSCVDS
jgi:hypothetical protein